MARRPRGHIEKRGDGVYRITIFLGRRPDGKPNRYRETFYGDRDAAEARLTALLHQMDVGKLATGGNMSFADLLRRWLRDYAELQTGYLTVQEYRRLIERRIIPALGQIPVGKLAPIHIQTFYASLQRDGARMDGKPGGLSARSIRQIHAIIHGTLAYAVDPLRIISHNPADNARLPKLTKPQKRRWNALQLQRFLAGIKDHPDRALMMTLAYTGMRLGEALALRVSDLDFATRTITVDEGLKRPGKNPVLGPTKSHQVREIPMDDELARVLRSHVAAMYERKLAMGRGWNPLDLVFPSEAGTPISKSNWRNRVWVPLLERLGLPYINIHGLRHTFGTLLAQDGTDPSTIRDLMGHHSAAFTMDEYVHSDEDVRRRAVSSFARRVSGR